MSRIAVVVQESVRPQRLIEDGVPLLVERGHDVLVCSLSGPGPLLDAMRSGGAETESLAGSSPASVPGDAIRLRGILRRWHPDVVHAHEVLPALVGGLASGRRAIFQRHHLAGSARLRAASWLATRVTRATIAVSDAVATRARDDDHRQPDRIAVARNGIATLPPAAAREVEQLRASLGLGDGVVLAVVARLRPEKGVANLLAALPRLADLVDRSVHLVVVGDGPDRARLAGLVPTRRPGEVHFVGAQDEVSRWYGLADVVVIPSEHEAMPLTAIEAMAAGRPVVASDVGGLPEVVSDGRTGVLVPPGSPDDLAAALAALASDPDRRQALGRAGLDRFTSSFTAAAMVAAWEDAYLRLGARR